MATKNGVPFRQWLIPSSKQSIKSPYKMTPKKITLHNTDNQMPAHNEISYMRNNNNQVSYHVAIDEKEAIQGLSYYRNGWHSGDGGNGYGNRNTIGVEICRNYDRSRKTTNLVEPLKSQYSKAEQNAVKFVAQLCIDLGIVANNNNIKTHNDWNGKWCPSKILNEKRLQSVKNGIIAEYNRLKGNKVKPSTPSKPAPSKPKPSKPSTSSWTRVSGNWTGQTLKRGQYGKPVRQLQELLASKHYYPKKGAKNNGIDGYFGADTFDAVKRYQSMHGLTVDGLPGKATYASLKGSTSKSKPKPKQAWTGQVLKRGSRGPAVRQLQEMLSAKYYYPKKGAKNNGVDGIYGKDTENAVRRYQTMHGLKVDGIAGRGTYNSLRK